MAPQETFDRAAQWGFEDWATGGGREGVGVERDHRADHAGPQTRLQRAHVVRSGVGLACAKTAHKILEAGHRGLSDP